MKIVIALDVAVAERRFSLMALLRDKRRNRMNADVLNKLMSVTVLSYAPKSILAFKTIVNDIRGIRLARFKR